MTKSPENLPDGQIPLYPTIYHNRIILQNRPDHINLILDKHGNVNFQLAIKMPSAIEETMVIPYYASIMKPTAIFCYVSDKLQLSVDEIMQNPSKAEIIEASHTKAGVSIESSVERLQATCLANDSLMSQYYNCGQKLVGNFINYKSFSWYDWSINNWGTPCNASDTSSLIITDDDHGSCSENINILFITKTSVPTQWLQHLCNIRKIPFEFRYASTDGQFGEINSDGASLQYTGMSN